MDNEATVRAGGISFAAEGVCVVEDLQKATIKQRTVSDNELKIIKSVYILQLISLKMLNFIADVV